MAERSVRGAMRAGLLLSLALIAVSLAGCVTEDPSTPSTTPDDQIDPGARPVAVVTTNMGTIEIELFSDLAPQTVQNFGDLAESGYYDGVRFHRVIEGFMIQGGDPKTKDASKEQEWGTGGPGYTIVDEFACQDGTISTSHPANCPTGLAVTHDRAGILSMANTGRPKTGGSQFFITLDATSWLDGKHAIFGRVIEGMEVVAAIGAAETGQADRPVDPIFMESVTIRGALPGVEVTKY